MEAPATDIPQSQPPAPVNAGADYNMAQPVVQPAPQAAAPVQPVVQAAPQFSNGGKTGAAKFFEGISMMDVIMGTLAIGSLALIVWHYKNKIKFAKIEYPELRASVEELKNKVDDMQQPEPEVKQSDAFSF